MCADEYRAARHCDAQFGWHQGSLANSLYCSTRILLVSQNTDPEIVQAALSDGAHGFVHKSKVNSDLVSAIKAILDGGRFVSTLAGDRTNHLV